MAEASLDSVGEFNGESSTEKAIKCCELGCRFTVPLKCDCSVLTSLLVTLNMWFVTYGCVHAGDYVRTKFPYRAFFVYSTIIFDANSEEHNYYYCIMSVHKWRLIPHKKVAVSTTTLRR